MLDKLLLQARSMGASDLHLTPVSVPMVRVDGSLQPLQNEFISREKLEQALLALLPEQEKRQLLQKGEIDTAFSDSLQERCRLNIYRLGGGYAAAIRLLPKDIPDCNSLGMPQIISQLAECSRGLLLVTGATGSGKSTTLACIIDEINSTRNAHVITLEDPIEYLHRHKQSVVTQREIVTDTDSYVTGLRASLRQAPDVILLGEMRDYETISIAMTAAETGHLILSTLHTVGAANTIDRVIDAFPPNQQQQIRTQLAMVLDAVISQQLIPTVDGGVQPAFEIMFLNNAIRNMIRESKIHQIDGIIATSQEEGMISMDNSLIKLYRDGVISRENAIAYSSNSELMEKKLAR